MYVLINIGKYVSCYYRCVTYKDYNPLTGLTPPYFCTCPKPCLGFITSYVVVPFFVFIEWRWEVVVCFDDVSWICYFYCLPLLLIVIEVVIRTQIMWCNCLRACLRCDISSGLEKQLPNPHFTLYALCLFEIRWGRLRDEKQIKIISEQEFLPSAFTHLIRKWFFPKFK